MNHGNLFHELEEDTSTFYFTEYPSNIYSRSAHLSWSTN